MPDTWAAMPVYCKSEDDWKITEKAIRSFRDTCDASLYVVDDNSPFDITDQIAGLVYDELVVAMANHENSGFTASVNKVMRLARANEKNCLLVNADMFFLDNGWLKAMEQNDADIVGGLLLYPNGLVQHAGVFFSVITRRFDHIYRLAPRTLAQVQEPRLCPVTGALMLVKRDTIKQIGILDENFRFGFEDIDYCQMAFKEGLKVAYEPKAEAVHHESWFAREPSKKHSEWMRAGLDYLHEKHRGFDFSDHIPTLIDWQE